MTVTVAALLGEKGGGGRGGRDGGDGGGEGDGGGGEGEGGGGDGGGGDGDGGGGDGGGGSDGGNGDGAPPGGNGGGDGGDGGGDVQTASVYLSHRRRVCMHVRHAVHGVRPVELQVDPESQLVAAFTIVNPKRPCEERRG